MKATAKINREGLEFIHVIAPNGELYEATRADAQSAWVVRSPQGEFRLFGTRKEVYSRINRKAGLTAKFPSA